MAGKRSRPSSVSERPRYSIELTRRASRDLAAVPVRDGRRIAQKIDALSHDPCPSGARKLEGEPDLYRIRSGHYRIIYQIQDDVLLVLVLMIRHRGHVYEDLRRLLQGDGPPRRNSRRVSKA